MAIGAIQSLDFLGITGGAYGISGSSRVSGETAAQVGGIGTTDDPGLESGHDGGQSGPHGLGGVSGERFNMRF